MNTRIALIVVAAAIWSASCRQPDAAIPTPDEETANRIGDLGRDLRAVARGEADAKNGFADDLAVFADDQESTAAVKAFGQRLSDAVVTAKLTDETAEHIANTSWRLVGVRDLSDRQVKALQDELRGQLVAVGVPQDRADAVVVEMPDIHRTVTNRPRRWYQVF